MSTHERAGVVRGTKDVVGIDSNGLEVARDGGGLDGRRDRRGRNDAKAKGRQVRTRSDRQRSLASDLRLGRGNGRGGRGRHRRLAGRRRGGGDGRPVGAPVPRPAGASLSSAEKAVVSYEHRWKQQSLSTRESHLQGIPVGADGDGSSGCSNREASGEEGGDE